MIGVKPLPDAIQLYVNVYMYVYLAINYSIKRRPPSGAVVYTGI